MAIAGITAGNVGGGGNSVYSPLPDFRQTINTTTTAASTNALPGGDYARVAVSGGAVWAKLVNTASPAIASAGNDFLIPDGGVLDIGPVREGDVISLVDAV